MLGAVWRGQRLRDIEGVCDTQRAAKTTQILAHGFPHKRPYDTKPSKSFDKINSSARQGCAHLARVTRYTCEFLQNFDRDDLKLADV